MAWQGEEAEKILNPLGFTGTWCRIRSTSLCGVLDPDLLANRMRTQSVIGRACRRRNLRLCVLRSCHHSTSNLLLSFHRGNLARTGRLLLLARSAHRITSARVGNAGSVAVSVAMVSGPWETLLCNMQWIQQQMECLRRSFRCLAECRRYLQMPFASFEDAPSFGWTASHVLRSALHWMACRPRSLLSCLLFGYGARGRENAERNPSGAPAGTGPRLRGHCSAATLRPALPAHLFEAAFFPRCFATRGLLQAWRYLEGFSFTH